MTAPSSATTPAIARPAASLRSWAEWLLSPEHFNFKLLVGSAVGVVAILVFAVTCFVATFQNQRQSKFRAHTISVMRLSSVLENDIAALENAHRGYLLTHGSAYLENFERRKDLFQRHSGEMVAVVANDSAQRKRILKMREMVWNWLNIELVTIGVDGFALPTSAGEARAALGAPLLDDAREILHTLQREEQIILNERMREQEWAVQSTQVLDFIPRLERAVYEMQKEKRGYILTADPAFIESYKRATADFYTVQGHLSVLVANTPAQLAELDHIRAGLENWIINSAVPDIETRRAGGKLSDASRSAGDSIMARVRLDMENFAKEQIEIYEVRAAAATHERILNATGIDALCVLVVGLMIASSCYSFILCRRQFTKLDSAEIRMRSVIDNILDGMVTLDASGTICSMNPAARRMFGYVNDADFSGHNFTRLIPRCFKREIAGTFYDCEWSELVKRTGGITLAMAESHRNIPFPVELSLSEMIVGKQRHYVAMIRDVTERKRFEEELAAERNSLAVTLGSIGDGVITIDSDAKVVITNAACEALTGWTSAEATGENLQAVFDIEDDITPAKRRSQPTAYRSVAEAILLGTPERATLTARDGTKRTIEQVAAPIYDSRKALTGVVLVFRDITSRLRDEAERRKAESLEQLGLLAGGIAHDFNNLLTAIIGNISLVSLLLPTDDKLTPRLNDAQNASHRARDLAQQLLTFARGGSPIKQTASAAKLIRDTVSFSLRGTESRSEITIAPDLWSAEFDSGQISQVVANLVVNADQAMPEGGTLRVSCDNFLAKPGTPDLPHNLESGEYIRIKVCDEGVGIPQKCMKSIFDPYFTTKPKGNGLGLATTYSIVKNHGGLITVESELQRGSTFTVYLPAAPVEPNFVPLVPTAVVEEKKPVEIPGTGRVLIVDDEEAIRMLVDFTLSRLGYEVAQAESSLVGIDLYRQALLSGRRFDLVILDLTLPGGMGGKDALKALLEIDSSVNAIVSSGYATDAAMSRYEDLGFRGVIAKPYEAAALGRKVHEMIESDRQRSQSHYELQQAC